MTRRVLALLTVLIMLCSFVGYAFADDIISSDTYVTDTADNLTESEEQQLNEKLAALSNQYDFDFLVLYLDSIGSDGIETWVDNHFAEYAHHDNGMMLVVSMEYRDYDIFSYGDYSRTVFEDYKREAVGTAFLPYLSSGNYVETANTFADETVAALTMYTEAQDVINSFGSDTYCYDYAILLNNSERASINQRLSQLSSKYGCDVLAVTVAGTDGMSIGYYVEANCSQWAHREDGVVMLISIGSNGYDYDFYTYGSLQQFFVEDVRTLTLNNVSFIFGNYAQTFNSYADALDSPLAAFASGMTAKAYVKENTPPRRYPIGFVFIALVLGAIVALISVSSMKGKLKSVRSKSSADPYIKMNSFRLTDKRDVLLYANVTKTRISESSSSGSGGGGGHHSSGHVSSGGSFHSSGGHSSGKF